MRELKSFVYQFDSGPLATSEELAGAWKVGNCRRALQHYFWESSGLFLKPEQVLCPAAYLDVGTFVFKGAENFDPRLLVEGDVLYAEKIRNRSGQLVDRSRTSFENENDYLVALHTAIFIGRESGVWHATAIEGASCAWPLSKFLYHYRPVAAKRLLPQKRGI